MFPELQFVHPQNWTHLELEDEVADEGVGSGPLNIELVP